MSDNVSIIRGAYEAFAQGNVPAVVGVMDPAVEWNEAEGFPYADGNPYVGPDAVVQGVFARIATEWEYWNIQLDHVLDAGDNVIVLGRYRAKQRGTGNEMDIQCAHVWWLRDGKITRFQQYADTAGARAAFGS